MHRDASLGCVKYITGELVMCQTAIPNGVQYNTDEFEMYHSDKPDCV